MTANTIGPAGLASGGTLPRAALGLMLSNPLTVNGLRQFFPLFCEENRGKLRRTGAALSPQKAVKKRRTPRKVAAPPDTR